ncbi:hypothetical protein HBH98_182710 [Parastagonospora nodorum]|nr:hypothetical protein HBH98_182710 [Parastagonospora nodorum]
MAADRISNSGRKRYRLRAVSRTRSDGALFEPSAALVYEPTHIWRKFKRGGVAVGSCGMVEDDASSSHSS